MITLETPSTDPLRTAWDEALLRLQLRVARCADLLSGSPGSDADRDRTIWSEAERIVLGEVPVTASAGAVLDAAA